MKETDGVLDNLNWPPSTLIICSRNRPRLLLETVRSVLDGDVVPDEMIVVDQSDECHPALTSLTDQHCDVRYLWSHQRGLSRANNLGISVARHPLLIFTHDDVLVERTWYRALLDALLTHGPRSVVTGRVSVSEEQAGGFQSTFKEEAEPAIYRGRIHRDVLLPLNMGMYRSAITEVGTFDYRLGPGTCFPGAEDNDLGFRLLEAGYTIYYAPQAIVYHRAWRPATKYLSLRWTYGVAQGAFYAKHLDARDHYILSRLREDLGRHARRLPLHIRWRDRRGLASDLTYNTAILWGLLGWSINYRLRAFRASRFQ